VYTHGKRATGNNNAAPLATSTQLIKLNTLVSGLQQYVTGVTLSSLPSTPLFPTVIGTTIGTPVNTLTQLRASIPPPLPVQVYLQDPVPDPPGVVEEGLVGEEVAEVEQSVVWGELSWEWVSWVWDVREGEGLASTGAAVAVAARAATMEMRVEKCMLEVFVML
jgi:hypothetical protein